MTYTNIREPMQSFLQCDFSLYITFTCIDKTGFKMCGILFSIQLAYSYSQQNHNWSNLSVLLHHWRAKTCYILHHVHEDCQEIAQKRQNCGSKIHSEVSAVDIKSPRKTAIARASSRKSPWQIYLSVLEIPTNKFAPVMGIASYACVRSELLLDGLNYTIIASHQSDTGQLTCK